MPLRSRELYSSPNGDRWTLTRDTGSGRLFVRHEANLASGGNVSDTDLGSFLTQGGVGPEKQELLRLIGSLVGDHEESQISHDRS